MGQLLHTISTKKMLGHCICIDLALVVCYSYIRKSGGGENGKYNSGKSR